MIQEWEVVHDVPVPFFNHDFPVFPRRQGSEESGRGDHHPAGAAASKIVRCGVASASRASEERFDAKMAAERGGVNAFGASRGSNEWCFTTMMSERNRMGRV